MPAQFGIIFALHDLFRLRARIFLGHIEGTGAFRGFELDLENLFLRHCLNL